MSTPITLTVPVPEDVTERYAQASGDRNPIHLDEAFARSVGLPGRILHGLWTAAHVARAAGQAGETGPLLGEGAAARYALASLELQFRGMGRIGPDLEISGQADTDADTDGTVAVTLSVTQDGTRLVRNARARVRTR
ncbi:MaoC/PaaZ C-terminal domain-containing protein [Conexibacter sp. DBS9H8]|uniref:MaoC/PaaZ C-terminal domain-containing protein n=1 Tax=Conexibacter sp. DBS9H8 TaxID=2937801 RepID=UPI00200C37CF|nr:MaoC/PaaZ C-terminal domain-containing protein [Conexibacter sp. DBS9H8]